MYKRNLFSTEKIMWECDFTGRCNGFVRSSTNGVYDWKSSGTGPKGDHTTGTGENKTSCD